MELKLAKSDLSNRNRVIKIDKIEKDLVKSGSNFYYFDKDNSDEDMRKMVDYFSNKGLSVYYRQVKYGLSDNEYMYEVHIL